MHEVIVAIDQGTSSTRCLIFTLTGEIIAQAHSFHEQSSPEPGYVTHDPLSIINSVHTTIDQALHQANIVTKNIIAVGITNQRETVLAWDRKTGQPLTPAIVWQDTRNHELVLQLTEHFPTIHSITGLQPSTYTSATKIQWLLNNISELAHNPHAVFGTIDSWLAFNLTGKYITDVTNASRTGLMDIHTCQYHPQLCELFGIRREQLPEITPSCQFFGEITSGSLAGIPLTSLLGDQHAALLGQGCITAGETKNTYGTGNFLLTNIGSQVVLSNHNLITTVAYQFHNQQPIYALEGSIAVSGSLISWLKNNMGILSQTHEIETLAASVPTNGGVYIVPAFSGLFAPYWRTDAQGIITGLTQHTTKSHIARAALESSALQTYDVYTAMNNDIIEQLSINPAPFLRVDGGMSVNSLMMQFQAEILNMPIIKPIIHENTALGAAFSAGLVAGAYHKLADITQLIHQDTQYEPLMDIHQRKKIIHEWHQAIKRSLL